MARKENTITRTVEVRIFKGYEMDLSNMTIKESMFEIKGIASTASAKQLDEIVKSFNPNVVKYEQVSVRYDLIEISESTLYKLAKEYGSVTLGGGRPPMNKQ